MSRCCSTSRPIISTGTTGSTAMRRRRRGCSRCSRRDHAAVDRRSATRPPPRSRAACRRGGEHLTKIAPGVCMDQSRWPSLQGPHNAQNALAAIAVAKALGVARRDIDRGLASFTGLPHRMERVATHAGVAYVNDSKATNPDSTAPALARVRPGPLDRRRAGEERRSRRLRAAFRPCRARLYDRRGGAAVRRAARTDHAGRPMRHARRRGRRGARATRCGRDGAAVARLC